MKLIKKLQECTSIEEAQPILAKLHARPSAKKLVETAILLSNSDDPQQKDHAFSFMATAIKEMEDDEKTKEEIGIHGHEDNLNNKKIGEIDDDDDEKTIHEEELDNHNNGQREDGSEQSSDNTEPYPGTAKDSTNGEKPMQDMDGTVNQWNETGGMPPGMAPGMGGMPGQQAMPGQGMMPGLAPDVAQEMGMVMPKLPPMDTNQMMRQVQYTLDNYHKRVVLPMSRLVKQQREAIRSLSVEIRETRTANGSMKLDMDTLRKNATVRFRETEGPNDSPFYQGVPMSGLQPQSTRKKDQLDMVRSEIAEMDKIIRSENSNIYG